MAFAAFVVDNMRKQNMLKEDKILLISAATDARHLVAISRLMIVALIPLFINMILSVRRNA